MRSKDLELPTYILYVRISLVDAWIPTLRSLAEILIFNIISRKGEPVYDAQGNINYAFFANYSQRTLYGYPKAWC